MGLGCESSEHVGLMNLDDVTIRVVQEDLVPTRNGPAAVIRVTNAKLIALAHEALDVIGAEAEVTVTHGVDELLHLEARIKVPLRPVELDIPVGQKVHLARVGAVITLTANDGVSLVVDGAQVKQRFVELRQPRQVVRADVHVVKLELHSDLTFVDMLKLPRRQEPSGAEHG